MAAERFPCTRLGAGAYTVTDPATGRTCTVYAEPMLDGRWIARADWVGDWYTDPLRTKREGVAEARAMLLSAEPAPLDAETATRLDGLLDARFAEMEA